ncbi:MAG: hypothetical protein V1754_01015, partial [Pseudomonadota bacterium]
EIAQKTIGKIFDFADSNYLEAWVLKAMIGDETDLEMAKEAWEQIETILVYRGKMEPFSEEAPLFAAGQHYLQLGRENRMNMFFDELWRQYRTSAWSRLAYLVVVEDAVKKGRWVDTIEMCQRLIGIWPNSKAAERCGELNMVAVRKLKLGPTATQGASHWVWDTPLPQGNSLNDVWVCPEGDVFAVGEVGTILRRYSGGQNFIRMASGTRWLLRGIWGSSSQNIYVVGDGGIVLHFEGRDWRQVREPRAEQADLWGVFSSGPGHVVAVGNNGTVVTLSSGGWTEKRVTTVNLRSVWGTGRDRLFAAGDSGTLLGYQNGKWDVMDSDCYEDLWSIWGDAPNNVYVVGSRRTVIHFDGVRAKEDVIGLTDFRSAHGFGGNDVWAVGTSGSVIRQVGKEWHLEHSGTLVELFGMAGLSPNELWAVGAGGTILRRSSGRWRIIAGGLRLSLVALDVLADGQAIALGEAGTLWYRQRKGQWSATSLPVKGRYRGFWANAGRKVAVGDDGLVVVDEGPAFSKVDAGTAEDLNAVWGWETGAVIVGNRGVIIRMTGGNIRHEHSPKPYILRSVWGKTPSDIVAVGDRGTILRFNGTAWIEESDGVLVDLYGVWVGQKMEVAVGQNGTIVWRAESGWEKMNSPTSQDLIAVWGTSAKDIYAISGQGSVIHYDGTRWEVQHSPAACLMAIRGDSNQNVFAVGCHGSVLKLAR